MGVGAPGTGPMLTTAMPVVPDVCGLKSAHAAPMPAAAPANRCQRLSVRAGMANCAARHTPDSELTEHRHNWASAPRFANVFGIERWYGERENGSSNISTSRKPPATSLIAETAFVTDDFLMAPHVASHRW